MTMKDNSSDEADASSTAGMPEEWVRAVLSIVIFIHLFCVAIAVAANYGRSALEANLLRILAPYSETFFLDLAFTQYQLTDGFPDHDDFLEIQPTTETFQPQGDPVRPDRGFRGSLALRRYQALARRAGQMGGEEGTDGFLGQIVRGVGGGMLKEQGWTHCIVRVRRRATRVMDPLRQQAAENPDDPSYYSTVYEANVWLDGNEVLLSKREASSQSAPASGSPPRPSATTPAAPATPAPMGGRP